MSTSYTPTTLIYNQDAVLNIEIGETIISLPATMLRAWVNECVKTTLHIYETVYPHNSIMDYCLAIDRFCANKITAEELSGFRQRCSELHTSTLPLSEAWAYTYQAVLDLLGEDPLVAVHHGITNALSSLAYNQSNAIVPLGEDVSSDDLIKRNTIWQETYLKSLTEFMDMLDVFVEHYQLQLNVPTNKLSLVSAPVGFILKDEQTNSQYFIYTAAPHSITLYIALLTHGTLHYVDINEHRQIVLGPGTTVTTTIVDGHMVVCDLTCLRVNASQITKNQLITIANIVINDVFINKQ